MASFLVAAFVAIGCDNAECTGAACIDAGPTDSGPPSDAGPCQPYVDINACDATDSCPAPEDVSFGVTNVRSLLVDPTGNTEIVDFVPGSLERAVAINAFSNLLVEIRYDATSIALSRTTFIETMTDTSITTSIRVAPNGQYAAVTAAEADCSGDRVIFVDVSDNDENFGRVLGSVPVGYAPDSSAFSPDGQYLVVADEGDNEFACDTVAGGSVTIIDLSGGPSAPELDETILVAHHPVSEPESVAIGPGNTVIITAQETGEVGFFDLDDPIPRTITFLALDTPNVGAQPDGLDISDTGRWAAVCDEVKDRLFIIDMATREVVTRYELYQSGDIPDSYHRDERDVLAGEIHEPEQLTFVRYQGALFVVFTLQQSHAVIAYRLNETDGSVTFDSIDITGIAWEEDDAQLPLYQQSSIIQPEGVAVHPLSGVILVANENEGSLTLLHSAGTVQNSCP